LVSRSDNEGSNNTKRKIRAHVLVFGKVQGVYFRQNTRVVASRHGVSGWIRNMKDGRVEIVLEGNEKDVGLVVEWCFTGPPNARVYDVDVNYEKYTGEFQDFTVAY
jgi:acylphosphatase